MSLPWLETFSPQSVQAQAAAAKKRYVVLYFPNGAAEFWHPTGTGSGDSWTLSPILEPLLPLKKWVTVLQGVGYQPSLQHCNPSHSQLGAGMTTCTNPDPNPGMARNAISVDQVIANEIGSATPFASLQVGLSTMDSYPDGQHPANSRSISWASPTQPLYKVINPQAVFDRIVGSANPTGGNMAPPDPMAERRRALKKSALDYVTEQATTLKGALSRSDSRRVDEFLTSARSLENRVTNASVNMTAGCKVVTRPTEAYTVSTFTNSGASTVMAGYNRNVHADIMIDLVVMALQCDVTRVISFMLDDARSDFPYIFLKARTFTETGSTPAEANVTDGNISSGLSGFHGLQHAGPKNDGFASINYWLTEKAALLTSKLAAATEGTASVLDNTTIHYGSGMHGGNHSGVDVPLALIGGHGGALKKDTYLPFAEPQMMQNVHLTVMQKVFGMTVPSFAASTGIIPELVA
jgi:Protein of unknown function (DUF1552)